MDAFALCGGVRFEFVCLFVWAKLDLFRVLGCSCNVSSGFGSNNMVSVQFHLRPSNKQWPDYASVTVVRKAFIATLSDG